MKKKTNYPFIFLHGMFGFGEGDYLNEYFMPYWGMLSGDLIKYLEFYGFEIKNPSLGGLGSAWDKACQLYAMLTGTRTDFGKVHSEKFGHERYGRTYDKPLLEKWDSENKINILGHSFGAPTIRMFENLLRNGSEEERKGTPKEELSPLFAGGKGDYIYSITSLCGCQGELTISESVPKFYELLRKATFGLANLESGRLLQKMWDMNADQFGIMAHDDKGNMKKAPLDLKKAIKVSESKDTVFYDLSVQGMHEMNENLSINPNIYYFSYSSNCTKPKRFSNKGHYVPMMKMSLAWKPISKAIGSHIDMKASNGKYIDKKYAPNDGLVNTAASTAPETEPSVDYNDVDKIKPGIWHVMDPMLYDHLQVVGSFMPPVGFGPLRDLYFNYCRMIAQIGLK